MVPTRRTTSPWTWLSGIRASGPTPNRAVRRTGVAGSPTGESFAMPGFSNGLRVLVVLLGMWTSPTRTGLSMNDNDISRADERWWARLSGRVVTAALAFAPSASAATSAHYNQGHGVPAPSSATRRPARPSSPRPRRGHRGQRRGGEDRSVLAPRVERQRDRGRRGLRKRPARDRRGAGPPAAGTSVRRSGTTSSSALSGNDRLHGGPGSDTARRRRDDILHGGTATTH